MIKYNQSGLVKNYFLDNTKFLMCEDAASASVEVDHVKGYGKSHLFVLKFIEDIMKKR